MKAYIELAQYGHYVTSIRCAKDASYLPVRGLTSRSHRCRQQHPLNVGITQSYLFETIRDSKLSTNVLDITRYVPCRRTNSKLITTMAPTPQNKASDLFNVNGLVAVITGGGSGLGLYAARALDANGAKAVYIVGRREETLKQAASTAVNGTIIPIVGDVSDKNSLKKVAEQIRQVHGYINFLFANAGIGGPKHASALPRDKKLTIQDFQDVVFAPEMDEFTKTLHLNTTAVFYTAAAFLDLLDAGNKKGNVPQDSQIVVTSSVAGLSRHLASSFAYSASKAAVNHVVKMLSTFLGQNDFKIRANVVAPGLYPSEMTQGSTGSMEEYQGSNGAFQGARKTDLKQSPAQRTGSEEDFAGAILFLASRAGAYINGETLVTDGGRVSIYPATY